MSENNNATIEDAKKTVEYLKQIETTTNSNAEKIEDFIKQLESKMNNAIEETNKKVEKSLDIFKIELHNQILEKIHKSIGSLILKKDNDIK